MHGFVGAEGCDEISVPTIPCLPTSLWELARQRNRHCKRPWFQVDISGPITGLAAFGSAYNSLVSAATMR
ncbi:MULTISPECIES: hypothetical protein [unclassified Pseudomonas]|uniref:hypothetical protein n=1 Tax=unclassified Pseudomonas TaxID=196821 RepID=UPI002AC9B44A|nr:MULTISPECIES: hypothetical protein [unclassified Pseudomonas]MEB0042033.1 hypothetical protein [Pseudomonas sp. MH10]MEB0121402.1 hypothetical protein [Pseudomonas sp. CCI1.2]WPX64130.1 hypothetical protein RHM59_00040 [Pseudomonas sp. MH10]